MENCKNNYEIILNLEENKLAKLLTELDGFCKACSFAAEDCYMNCFEGHKDWLLNKKSINLKERGDLLE